MPLPAFWIYLHFWWGFCCCLAENHFIFLVSRETLISCDRAQRWFQTGVGSSLKTPLCPQAPEAPSGMKHEKLLLLFPENLEHFTSKCPAAPVSEVCILQKDVVHKDCSLGILGLLPQPGSALGWVIITAPQGSRGSQSEGHRENGKYGPNVELQAKEEGAMHKNSFSKTQTWPQMIPRAEGEMIRWASHLSWERTPQHPDHKDWNKPTLWPRGARKWWEKQQEKG